MVQPCEKEVATLEDELEKCVAAIDQARSKERQREKENWMEVFLYSLTGEENVCLYGWLSLFILSNAAWMIICMSICCRKRY